MALKKVVDACAIQAGLDAEDILTDRDSQYITTRGVIGELERHEKKFGAELENKRVNFERHVQPLRQAARNSDYQKAREEAQLEALTDPKREKEYNPYVARLIQHAKNGGIGFKFDPKRTDIREKFEQIRREYGEMLGDSDVSLDVYANQVRAYSGVGFKGQSHMILSDKGLDEHLLDYEELESKVTEKYVEYLDRSKSKIKSLNLLEALREQANIYRHKSNTDAEKAISLTPKTIAGVIAKRYFGGYVSSHEREKFLQITEQEIRDKMGKGTHVGEHLWPVRRVLREVDSYISRFLDKRCIPLNKTSVDTEVVSAMGELSREDTATVFSGDSDIRYGLSMQRAMQAA